MDAAVQSLSVDFVGFVRIRPSHPRQSRLQVLMLVTNSLGEDLKQSNQVWQLGAYGMHSATAKHVWHAFIR